MVLNNSIKSKRIIISIISGFLIIMSLSAQTYYKFAVEFKDKAPGQNPYNLDNPLQFLSQRSIDRRNKLNVPLTDQDLPVHPQYVSNLSTVATGYTVFHRSRWFNHVVVGTEDSTIANSFKTLAFVNDVKLIYRGPIPKSGKTKGNNHRMNAERTGVNSVNTNVVKSENTGVLENLEYGNSKVQVEMMGVDYLHRKGYMGQGIMIAVLDGGFQNVNNISAFDYIRNNNLLEGTWDFVVNDSNVYDDNNHGTNVLSCMAGYIDGQFIGTSPKASYWLLRSEDTYTETISEEYNWVAAAEFADSVGADMINSSLGYTTFDNGLNDHSYNDLNGNTTVITRAADIAASKGILVVNSAGNSGNSGWYYIGAPADADSILSVGAVTDKRVKAGFSSFGPSADGRIKPDVSAMGQAVFVVGAGGNLTQANGTSFSSPLLCGAVASLWSKYPNLSNLTILEAVRKAGHQFSVPDNELGYGIPNFGVAELILSNTDFQDYFKNQEIKVYPNPIENNTFYIDFYSNFTENIKIDISNTKGKSVFTSEKSVYEKSVYTLPIMLDRKLSSGVYIITIQTSTKRFTGKFIIPN